MAYATYTTEAIVCGSKDSFTSDRSYLLFTERGGMLWASARSVREEKSRQRYALQDFSHVRVSLVRGRSGWRIGSVSALTNAFSGATNREARGLVTKVVRLIRQFVHGEEPHPKLFADTVALFQLSSANDSQTEPLLELYTLRLLHSLGYVAPQSSYQTLLEEELTVISDLSLPKEAKQAIERAQEVSHL